MSDLLFPMKAFVRSSSSDLVPLSFSFIADSSSHQARLSFSSACSWLRTLMRSLMTFLTFSKWSALLAVPTCVDRLVRACESDVRELRDLPSETCTKLTGVELEATSEEPPASAELRLR